LSRKQLTKCLKGELSRQHTVAINVEVGIRLTYSGNKRRSRKKR